MSVGKLRGHLFTIKSQAEGALAAGKEVDIEMGALKRENSTNKYLLQRIENIVFGKHNPKGDTEELVERIKAAVEQDETLKEVQRLRNLEFSLRNELNKVEKDLSSWRQDYDQLFNLFGRLQDLVLGKDSVTETYEDLYKPIEDLVSLKKETAEALGVWTSVHSVDTKMVIRHIRSGAKSRTYTPPDGFILIAEDKVKEIIQETIQDTVQACKEEFIQKFI